jgi:hypothetical protein
VNRRGFLRFLGIGMAAATLNPGQLIAAVSHSVQIAMSTPAITLIEAKMLEATESLRAMLAHQVFAPLPASLIDAGTRVTVYRGIQRVPWHQYSQSITFEAPRGLLAPQGASG